MPTDVLVEREPTTGATYCYFSRAPVAATHHVSDLVLVDLDARGQVIGVEFVGGIALVSDEEWGLLAQMAPSEAAALRNLS